MDLGLFAVVSFLFVFAIVPRCALVRVICVDVRYVSEV
jgi:hypothetical protein